MADQQENPADDQLTDKPYEPPVAEHIDGPDPDSVGPGFVTGPPPGVVE